MSDMAVSETIALVSQRLSQVLADVRAAAVPLGAVPLRVAPIDVAAAVETLESSVSALAVVVEALAVEREALLSLRSMVDLLIEAPR